MAGLDRFSISARSSDLWGARMASSPAWIITDKDNKSSLAEALRRFLQLYRAERRYDLEALRLFARASP